MRLQKLGFVFTLFAFFSAIAFADIPYCQHTKASADENKALQPLVSSFAKDMQCQVGKNCLLKWTDQNGTTKFSIAWQSFCGPVINGIPQLGDQGHGSTFICQKSKNKGICCWPYGYDYAKQYVVCSQ